MICASDQHHIDVCKEQNNGISCNEECRPVAFIAGKYCHMHAVCAACMDKMTEKHIRECEYMQGFRDLDDYSPGLIEDEL